MRQEAGFDDYAVGRSSVHERGRDGLNSPCAIIFILKPVPKTAESIMCFRTEEKGNPLEGRGNQSTFEGAVTEWANTLRLTRTGAAGRHTKTRDRRAYHHESSCHRFFFLDFDDALAFFTTYVTGFCRGYPSWGTTPRNSQGRDSAVCAIS